MHTARARAQPAHWMANCHHSRPAECRAIFACCFKHEFGDMTLTLPLTLTLKPRP